MNLNREQIIKALECCIKTQCENCCNLGNWHEQWNCMTDLMRNALTIINQLTEDNTKLANLLLEKDVIILEQGKFVEENERLKTELRQTAQKLKTATEVNDKLTADNEWLKRPRYNVHPDGKIEMIPTIESVRADTVREMHSMLCEGRVSNDTVVIVANQIAKEMLEG